MAAGTRGAARRAVADETSAASSSSRAAASSSSRAAASNAASSSSRATAAQATVNPSPGSGSSVEDQLGHEMEDADGGDGDQAAPTPPVPALAPRSGTPAPPDRARPGAYGDSGAAHSLQARVEAELQQQRSSQMPPPPAGFAYSSAGLAARQAMGDPRPLVVPVPLARTETPRASHLDEVGRMLVAHGIDPTSGRGQSPADRLGLSSDHKLRKYCFMSKPIRSEETIDAETLSLLKMLREANSRDYVQFLFEVEQVVKMLNLPPLQARDLRSLLSNMTFSINHIPPLGTDVAEFALDVAYTKDGRPAPPPTPKEFPVKNPGDAIARMTTLKAYMEVFYPHERRFSKYCDRFVVLASQMTNMDKLVTLELNARHTVLTLGYDWVEVLDRAIMHYVDGLGLKRGWATSSRDSPSSSLSPSGPAKPAKIARTDDAYTPPAECLSWNGNGGKCAVARCKRPHVCLGCGNANHVWADCQNRRPGSISPAAHLALMGGARRGAKQ